MSSNTSSKESHASENEDKTTKTETLDNNLTTVELGEVRNDDNARQKHGANDKVINVDKMTILDVNIAKEMAQGQLTGKHPVVKPPHYWVQFNFAQGNQIPMDGIPLDYDPDRNFFVRIVFSIVLFMLILTAGFVAFVYLTDAKRLYMRYGMFFMIIGMVGMLSLNYAMMCSQCTRVPPCNFVCLFLAVSFMSLIAAYVTIRYRTQIVLLALLATIVTVIVCVCLACTRFDFTRFLLYVIVISVAFGVIVMIISITMLVTGTRFTPLVLAILVIGTLLNVVILIMELQMILGGRTVELSEDDYALGAFMLYTSIVDIFLRLVQILGIIDDS
ncbi:uncharacterized protein LOC124642167 [Helicoverpa zea]|uniref:uncharacterized protein LOC124642167 n=1 Tax=Helicoverpa zea TaxID=7113 RepID=UPI001F5774A5|nr:uncharacterized protein LOC124642167 [Helicoverpa zea]